MSTRISSVVLQRFASLMTPEGHHHLRLALREADFYPFVTLFG